MESLINLDKVFDIAKKNLVEGSGKCCKGGVKKPKLLKESRLVRGKGKGGAPGSKDVCWICASLGYHATLQQGGTVKHLEQIHKIKSKEKAQAIKDLWDKDWKNGPLNVPEFKEADKKNKNKAPANGDVSLKALNNSGKLSGKAHEVLGQIDSILKPATVLEEKKEAVEKKEEKKAPVKTARELLEEKLKKSKEALEKRKARKNGLDKLAESVKKIRAKKKDEQHRNSGLTYKSKIKKGEEQKEADIIKKIKEKANSIDNPGLPDIVALLKKQAADAAGELPLPQRVKKLAQEDAKNSKKTSNAEKEDAKALKSQLAKLRKSKIPIEERKLHKPVRRQRAMLKPSKKVKAIKGEGLMDILKLLI